MVKKLKDVMFAGAATLLVVSGCSTTQVAGPGESAVELQAVNIDDRELRGKKVTLTERRSDGAWSVTYMYDDRFGRWDSRVVVTDWQNERHYDVPSLEGIRVTRGAWDADGNFVFEGDSKMSLTLVFPEDGGHDVAILVDGMNYHGGVVSNSPLPNMSGYGSNPVPSR